MVLTDIAPAETQRPRNIQMAGGDTKKTRTRTQRLVGLGLRTSSSPDPSREEDEALRRIRKETIKRTVQKRERAKMEVRRDRQLAATVGLRWDPNIDPSSSEFQERLQSFNDLLNQTEGPTTIEQILRFNFSQHERDLLLPADRKRNPALAAIQSRNKVLYAELLRSKRFKKWAPKANLAFKLTMASYGLPVAPLTVDSAQQWAADESDLDGAGSDWMRDKGEPAEGRLRFLNDYHVRMYEWDGIRRMLPENLNPLLVTPLLFGGYVWVHVLTTGLLSFQTPTTFWRGTMRIKNYANSAQPSAWPSAPGDQATASLWP